MKAQLAEGKDCNSLYIFLCFVLALLGGLLAVYAGCQSKIKTPEGESYYAYNKETRQLGKWMMVLGGAVFLFLILR